MRVGRAEEPAASEEVNGEEAIYGSGKLR